jgi:hypothetical protein
MKVWEGRSRAAPPRRRAAGVGRGSFKPRSVRLHRPVALLKPVCTCERLGSRAVAFCLPVVRQSDTETPGSSRV